MRPNTCIQRLEVILEHQTYRPSLVLPDARIAKNRGTRKAGQTPGGNDPIVPPGLLHGRVREPWLLVLASEPVTLEFSLGRPR